MPVDAAAPESARVAARGSRPLARIVGAAAADARNWISARAAAGDFELAVTAAENTVTFCTLFRDVADDVDAGHRQQFAVLLEADLIFTAGHDSPTGVPRIVRPLAASSASMPRRLNNSPLRYTPLALSDQATDFAASSARLNASTVLISGFGAPLRTAIAILERTRSTVVPAATWPLATSGAMASLATMITSSGSPRSSRIGMAVGACPSTARAP